MPSVLSVRGKWENYGFHMCTLVASPVIYLNKATQLAQTTKGSWLYLANGFRLRSK